MLKKGSIIVNKTCGYYSGLGDERLKRKAFEHFQKTISDGADVMFHDRVFLSRGAATAKARSLMTERRVRWKTSDDDEAERRR